ncbi:alpha/beta fold hydrolase [Brevibacterium sp.]|uniref:alpha/beta fold hydrolase n=1 Tax=Brevibacterium sp. TaxID=1701 RepID=UPI002811EECB|nr:alpha/beta fold hydrolase [Brevibacterium sp.]
MATRQRSNAPRRIDGLEFTEHFIEVPLDHAHPQETITVFAREVAAVDKLDRQLPHLLWFQGGPGNKADRPAGANGWLKRALEDFRVILLDQRGTGLSTPLSRESIPDGLDARGLAEYAAHFRADAIIADAEAVRRYLGIEKWSVLGQSYGGFLAVSYLSKCPESLREVMITAGLPTLSGNADEVYRHTLAATARRSDEFFATFPAAEDRIWDIVDHLDRVDEHLPSGERLSVERLQTLGIQLGSDAGFRALSYQLETAFIETPGGPRLSDVFLRDVEDVVSFARRPLYALLHESIYSRGAPTAWAAHRVREELEEFSPKRRRGDGQFRFTGEMVFPWQFEQDPALVPFAAAAEALASAEGLSDPFDDEALAANTVPVAAAVYVDDMFVPYELSVETAERIGGVDLHITNEYQHDGIRQDGYALVSKLLDSVRKR